MIDLNAELESAKSRILEIRKSIIFQTRVLRELSDRGMDKTLGERMLDVRRYYLERTTAHAVLIEYQFSTRFKQPRLKLPEHYFRRREALKSTTRCGTISRALGCSGTTTGRARASQRKSCDE
jgi:hypothetical protein